MAVTATRDGAGLWLVGQGWLGQFRDGKLEVLCEDPTLVLPDAGAGVAITADIVGGLFFGDSRAVFAYHPTTGLEVIDRRSGRSPVGVLSLLTDYEGTVWFTAYRGVGKLSGRSLVSYDSRHGLLEDEVTALLERPDGTWLLGHNNGITILGPRPRRLRFPARPGHYGRVMDFEADTEGRVWIAADRLGLAWLTGDTTFVWVDPDSGVQGPVSSVKCDRQGRLWVANQHGLFYRQGDRFLKAPIPGIDFKRGNGIRRIELAADGSLLVASARSGLFRVEGGRGARLCRAAAQSLQQRFHGPRTGRRAHLGSAPQPVCVASSATAWSRPGRRTRWSTVPSTRCCATVGATCGWARTTACGSGTDRRCEP